MGWDGWMTLWSSPRPLSKQTRARCRSGTEEAARINKLTDSRTRLGDTRDMSRLLLCHCDASLLLRCLFLAQLSPVSRGLPRRASQEPLLRLPSSRGAAAPHLSVQLAALAVLHLDEYETTRQAREGAPTRASVRAANLPKWRPFACPYPVVRQAGRRCQPVIPVLGRRAKQTHTRTTRSNKQCPR